ncbi:nucleotide exchange factor GrpE [Candidatus Gracilibacteria bacterium]|nr:nucleotide exchange factor GrpE [Candidatus Gracilibacteria bacterium]
MKKDEKGSPQLQKIEALENELVSLQKKLEEAENAQMRALADLQNFQRREAEQKKNWVSFGVAEFLKQFLPRLLELQLGSEHSSDKDVKKVVESFFESLQKAGLEPISPRSGDSIDPEFHEVLMTEEGKAGCVVRTLEPGWKFGEVILTPAKVSAAQH